MRQDVKRTAVLVVAACVIGCLSVRADAAGTQAPPASSVGHAQNVAFQDLKWQKMVPELADRSPEIVILRVDPTTQASRHPESGFKALANFREFRAAVLPRVTKAGADDRTNRLRSLARQALDAKEPGTGSRSGSGERADKAPQPAGLPLSWPKLLLIGGGLVVLAGLVVLVLKLLDIFG